MRLVAIVALQVLLFVPQICAIKVCRDEFDYYLPYSRHCWDNPADRMTVTEILKNLFGFYTEEHQVTTKDGYTLTLARFHWNVSKKNPVIIGHGTCTSSYSFVARMENSLAYMLGTEGYDVWLINFRGSKYSREHDRFDVDEDLFWDFSFHEIGIFDLSSIISYVYSKTNSKALYVGTSMGCSALLVYSSIKPTEAKEKLMGAVLAAPAGKFKDQNSTLTALDPTSSILPYVLPKFYHGAILYDSLPLNVLRRVIMTNPLLMRGYYKLIFNSIDGYHPDQIDWATFPILHTSSVDITTAKIQIHFAQCIRSGEFKHFDYGIEENIQKYNSSKPPFYLVENITIPIAILVSNGDLVTPIGGTRELYDQLPKESKCGFFTVRNSLFTHIDTLGAKDVGEEINKPIIDYLQKIESDRCQV